MSLGARMLTCTAFQTIFVEPSATNNARRKMRVPSRSTTKTQFSSKARSGDPYHSALRWWPTGVYNTRGAGIIVLKPPNPSGVAGIIS